MSTVQDLGRPGMAWLGVPPSGAADAAALRLVNGAAGNSPGSAAIEITLLGAAFEALGEITIAIGGTECSARIESAAGSRDVRPLIRTRMLPGDIVRIGPARKGCRTYLAISGGIEVAAVMGSRSTLLSAGFGGHEGRALRAGDVLECRLEVGVSPEIDAAAGERLLGQVRSRQVLRMVPGPQYATFDQPGRLVDGALRVSSRSDRTGIRLEGRVVASPFAGRMSSQPMLHGAIQVPPSGEPIVLMCDHPTTGGYPVVGCVISADLPVLGQRRPGDDVRFEWVTIAEARRLAAELEQQLRRCSSGVGNVL
jgi:biotin-dependent carboxylase-like uncharacterized protein